jgi:hypothetical protein
MTVRQAEFLMALATIAASLGLMWSASDGLAIGWVPEKGPGSGFWPFWLSFGMLLASVFTLIRWFMGATPESRSTEPYMSRNAMVVVGIAVSALLFLLIGIHVVGIYLTLPLFLFFYIRIVGKHTWAITVLLVFGVPVFIFTLFEWGLQIPLPKAITEEWFYPVFDVMYGSGNFWMYIVGLFAVIAGVSFALHKLVKTSEG